jgi:hypothetical protein
MVESEQLPARRHQSQARRTLCHGGFRPPQMVKFAQNFAPMAAKPQKPAQLAIFFIAGMAGAKMLPAGFPSRFSFAGRCLGSVHESNFSP